MGGYYGMTDLRRMALVFYAEEIRTPGMGRGVDEWMEAYFGCTFVHI